MKGPYCPGGGRETDDGLCPFCGATLVPVVVLGGPRRGLSVLPTHLGGVLAALNEVALALLQAERTLDAILDADGAVAPDARGWLTQAGDALTTVQILLGNAYESLDSADRCRL